MILTTCAACAAPLAHNAPRCVRCKYDEACSFASERIPECQRVLGTEHENTLFLRTIYAHALSASDPEQAETILVDVTRIARRVLGPSHPRTSYAERSLSLAQKLGSERKQRGE